MLGSQRPNRTAVPNRCLISRNSTQETASALLHVDLRSFFLTLNCKLLTVDSALACGRPLAAGHDGGAAPFDLKVRILTLFLLGGLAQKQMAGAGP